MAEDAAFIKGIQREENSSMAALMAKYQSAIFYKMLSSVKNEEDARDLTMETFTKVFEKAASYKENTGAVSTWVFTIANNCLIDFYRKEKINNVNIDDTSVDVSENATAVQVADTCDIADGAIERGEKYTLLMATIEKKIKNEEMKLILKLRYIDELSYEEIAARVGQPLGTVKNHLFRARDILKKCLKNKSGMFV